ncbi:MAG: AraC family transcriptional regulator [Cyclobacteriaceae bacterium]
MDALSDILEKIKLSSAVYFQSDFSSPWGMDVPSGPYAQFHIVTKGKCLLKAQSEVVELCAGDLIVFPRGTEHWLADSLSSTKIEGTKVVQSIVSGDSIFQGDHVSTTLVCGHFEFDRLVQHTLINSLPEIIYITQAQIEEKEWLKNIITLITQETSAGRQGNEVVIRKLGEILFIHALREYIDQSEIENGFLGALKDERISTSLKLMHNSPEEKWTLESLARSVGMSRTSLSNKFRDLVGETPMNYLANWRILNAKELLKESDLSVREVAHKIGYQSEAAFNRVFKDRVKITPLKFRNSV